jgi:hypothetical protein
LERGGNISADSAGNDTTTPRASAQIIRRDLTSCQQLAKFPVEVNVGFNLEKQA